MVRFAQLLISGDFACGVARYQDHHPGEEEFARLVLPVTLEGSPTVLAILDTGAPWCVLAPEIIERFEPSVLSGYEPGRGLSIRGTSYKGRLLRMRIGLRAEHGDDLEVEATVFVPMLPPGDTWRHPNFIGLDGFLNRIRFAVDPAENAFYFGLIE